MSLDYNTPQGNPEAIFCRWCQRSKIPLRGALICTTCDGPLHLLVRKGDS